MTDTSGLISMLKARGRELRDWRTGGHNLPHGLASALLDAEHRLEQAAHALEAGDAEIARLRAVIAEAMAEAELSNFKGDGYLDDRSLAVKERAEDVLAILAKAERS